MADIIPFFPSPSPGAEKLAEFSVSQNPLDYLDALEMTLVAKARLDAFLESYRKFLSSCESTEWFAVFARACRILARIDWNTIESASPQPSSVRVPPTEEFLTVIKNFGAAITQAEETRKELERKATAKGMGRFPPGFRFVDAFDELYGNDNPLDYINQAIGILIPKQTYTHSDDCWFENEESIKPNKQALDFLVSKIIEPLMVGVNQAQLAEHQSPTEQTTFLKRKSLAAIAPVLTQFFLEDLGTFSKWLTDHVNSSDITIRENTPLGSYDSFLAYVLQPGNLPIPQGLLTGVVRKILDTDFEPGDRDEEEAAEVGLYLLGWPIGAPADNWTDIQEGLFESETLIGFRACYKNPKDAPFLPCRLLTIWLYPLYGNAMDFSDVLGDKIYSQAMQRYSDKLSRLSARKLDGKFPWEPWKSSTNWYAYPYRHSSSWNLLLFLHALEEELRTCDSGGFFRPGADDYGDDEVEGFVAFNLYRDLWLACEQQGLGKLGNAVFAFYLMRKTITSWERNASPEYDWPALVEQLERCMAQPGSDWVRKALAITKQASEQWGWEMVWLRHDNLPGIGVSFSDLTSVARTSDDVIDLGMEAERELAEKYGPLLGRFCDRSRRMLIKAETNYRRHSRRLGLHANEYGSEALDYAKCFENELDERLQSLYLGDQVQLYLSRRVKGWRNFGEPTLGTYNMFLERVNDMPEDLQVLIKMKIGSLAGNAEVLGQLRKLQKIRNRGAHPSEEVSASNFTELRELIHSDGLLEGFLNEISSAS